MLKVGDTAIVNTDDGRLYKGCEVVILLDMGEKAKRVGDLKAFTSVQKMVNVVHGMIRLIYK